MGDTYVEGVDAAADEMSETIEDIPEDASAGDILAATQACSDASSEGALNISASQQEDQLAQKATQG